MENEGPINEECNAFELEKEDIVRRNRERMEELGLSTASNPMRQRPRNAERNELAALSVQQSAPAGDAGTRKRKRGGASTKSGGEKDTDGSFAAPRRSTRSRTARAAPEETPEQSTAPSGAEGTEDAAGDRAARHAERQAFLSQRKLSNSGAGPPPRGAAAPFGGQRYKKLATGIGNPPLPWAEPSEGIRDKHGRLVFKDAAEFKPNLTPSEMIRRGIFGGCYFNPKGGKAGIFGRTIAVDHREYPQDWFAGLPDKMYTKYDASLNAYKVKAGQDQAFWERKGWIHRQDPRGWFQWYTRFYLGRRTEDDARQISRWKGVAGEKGRWKNALCNKILACGEGAARVDDTGISPVIRQTLLHWGYELTRRDLESYAKRKK